MPHASPIGILAMALGGPGSLDEVEPYLREVRGGRPTSQELVEEFRGRYRRIGGRSPLLDLSKAQAKALETRLRSEGHDVRVYVGMRHWHPFIREALVQMHADGIRRLVALCLTPYYSRMSVGAYLEAMQEGFAQERLDFDVTAVERWSGEPALASAYAEKVQEGLAALVRSGFRDPVALFTAHSLPRRVIEEGDPYERELQETMAAILARLPRLRARMAWQSAGRTADPWLGPPYEEVIRELGAAGEKAILVVPFGFVSDHLEILYDVDVQAKEIASEAGVHLERTESLNDDPGLVEALAAAVRPRLTP